VDGKIHASYMLSNISGSQIEFIESQSIIEDSEHMGTIAAKKLKKLFNNYQKEVLGIV
jgi:hypothetical protein